MQCYPGEVSGRDRTSSTKNLKIKKKKKKKKKKLAFWASYVAEL